MRLVAIVTIVAASVVAHADEVEVSTHFGFTRATFDEPTLPEAKGHGFVFLVEGSYELVPSYIASLRIPAVLVSVAQPAGAYADRAVLGNPQLRVARRMLDRPRVGAGLELGAPLAGHGDDLLPNRALAIADGIEGRGAPELFAPGVMPATVFGEVLFDARPWRFDGSVRVPWLLRISDADMSSTNAVDVAAVLAARGQRRMTRRLTAGVSTQLVADRVGLQDLERIHLSIRIGGRTELTLAFQAAIGGELGGSTFGGGIRVVSTL
jgi:hypothetical protein